MLVVCCCVLCVLFNCLRACVCVCLLVHASVDVCGCLENCVRACVLLLVYVRVFVCVCV